MTATFYTPDFIQERELYRQWKHNPPAMKKRKSKIADRFIQLLIVNEIKRRHNNSQDIPCPAHIPNY